MVPNWWRRSATLERHVRRRCSTNWSHAESDRACLAAPSLTGHVAHSRHVVGGTPRGKCGVGQHPPDRRAVRGIGQLDVTPGKTILRQVSRIALPNLQPEECEAYAEKAQ